MPFRSQPFMRMMLVLIILLCAGISPNVFVAVQAGWNTFPVLLREWLLPSFLVLWVCVGLDYWMFDRSLARQVLIGAGSGVLATVGLELVREIGFHIGWMPGDMPKLIGVLILNRFAMGPNGASNIAGWTYHCWNGACFGVIYTLLLGRGRVLWGGIYGLLIGVGFMISPVTRALGIGAFGLQYLEGYQFLIVVTLAHLVFGFLLGYLVYRSKAQSPSILDRCRMVFPPSSSPA